MARFKLILEMADGTTREYMATCYNYSTTGALLQFTQPDGQVKAVILGWVKTVTVLMIDAATTDC